MHVFFQIVVFVGYFLASIAMTCHLNIGLDQALSMPEVGEKYHCIT